MVQSDSDSSDSGDAASGQEGLEAFRKQQIKTFFVADSSSDSDEEKPAQRVHRTLQFDSTTKKKPRPRRHSSSNSDDDSSDTSSVNDGVNHLPLQPSRSAELHERAFSVDSRPLTPPGERLNEPVVVVSDRASSTTMSRECTLVPKWKAHARQHPQPNRPSLYERGIVMRERAAVELEVVRRELQKTEEANMTFKPEISSRAKKLKRPAHRGPTGAMPDAPLHKRTQLMNASVEEFSFSPSISHKSKQLVHRSRAQSASFLPTSERLYRDYMFRDKQNPPPPSSSAKVIVRTAGEIEEHVASLYMFERKKNHMIDAIREQQDAAYQGELFVDSAEVTRRLTTVHSPETSTCADSREFQPHITTKVPREHRQRAVYQGVRRWFGFFAANKSLLHMNALDNYRGPYVSTAGTILSALRAATPDQVEWSEAEFISIFTSPKMEATQSDWWRCKPVVADDPSWTFRPHINPGRSCVAEAVADGSHRVPAHERLYTTARAKQLQDKQDELERQQAALLEEEREVTKRNRYRRWWEQSTKRKEAVLSSPPEDAHDMDVDLPAGHVGPNVAQSISHIGIEADGQAEDEQPVPKHPPSPTPVVAVDASAQVSGIEPPVPSLQYSAGASILPSSTLMVMAELSAVLQSSTSATLAECHASTPILCSAMEPSDSIRRDLFAEETKQSEDIGAFDGAPMHQSVLVAKRGSNRPCGASNLLLKCASCPNPALVCSTDRAKLELENRKKLRRFGRELYNQSLE